MNNSYQKGVVFSFNLYYTYGVINKEVNNMNYVLVAKFRHEEDAEEYCSERGHGCFVTDLIDGSYGVYEPLETNYHI